MSTALANPNNPNSGRNITAKKFRKSRAVQTKKTSSKGKDARGNHELAEVKRQLKTLTMSIPKARSSFSGVNCLMEMALAQPGVDRLIAMVIVPNRRNAVRWPDDTGLPTALYVSTRAFTVQTAVGTDLGANSGKFTICTQPKLGVPVGVANFATDFSPFNVLFGSAIQWPAQTQGAVAAVPVTYSNMYQALINGDVAGADPELDHLVGDRVGYARFASSLTGETHPIPFGDAVTPATTNSLLTGKGAPTYSISNLAGVPTSSWLMPIGIWQVTLTFTTSGVTNAFNPTATATWGGQFNTPSTNTAVSMENNLTANFAGGLYNGVTTTFLVNINDPKTALFFTPLLNVSTFQAANVTAVTATFVPTMNLSTTTSFQTWPMLPAGLLLENVRPVAHSLLFTSELSDLDNAGDISAYSFGPEVIKKQYLVDKPEDPGPMQEAGTLANYQGAYNGPLKKGGYAFFSHADETQLEFKSYTDMNATDFGGCCISGIHKPNVVPATATVVSIGRVIVVTVYEIGTVSRLLQVGNTKTIMMALDVVKQLLRGQPMAMQNDIHEWFATQVERGNKWAKKILPYIQTGLQVAKLAGTLAV